MQDAGNPLDAAAQAPDQGQNPLDQGVNSAQPGTSAPDPTVSVPTDPNTGVPIISVGTHTGPQQEGAPTPQPGPDQGTTQVAQADTGYSSGDVDALDKAIGGEPGEQPNEGAGMAPSGYTQDDVDSVEKAMAGSQIAGTKGLGWPMDAVRSFNEDLLRAGAGIYRGAAVLGASEAAQSEGATPDFQKQMEGLGEQYLRDPNAGYVDAARMFDALGIQHSYPQSYMGDAGRQIWNTIATSLAIQYGAASLTAKLASRGVGELGDLASPVIARVGQMITQKYTQAVAQNPGMWIASEALGGMGASVGGEEARDYAQTRGAGPVSTSVAEGAGGLAGAIFGGGAGAWVTAKIGGIGLRISKAAARQIWNAAQNIGGESGLFRSADYTPSPNIVDPVDLETARTAEYHAQAAGDDTVQARKWVDLVDKTGKIDDQITAQYALKAAMDVEDAKVKAAEAAWAKLPKDARGPWSREQTALRSKYAEVNYPSQFAERQVQGGIALAESKIADTLSKLGPDDVSNGVMQASAKLNKDLWTIRDMAKGTLAKYWRRVKLDRPMTQRGMFQRALDGINRDFHEEYDDSQYPKGEIEELYARFANSVPNAELPSLNYMKNKMSALFEAGNRAYSEGKYILARNYNRLYSAMMGAVSRSFPEDVALQQARAESKSYFDFFGRSDISRLFAASKRGNPNVRPEDTLDALLRSPHAFNDLQRTIAWLDRKGVVKISDPDYMTKAAKQNLAAIREDTKQAIRSNFQDYIEKVEGDPIKVAKYLGNPAFQRQLSSVGDIAATMRQAAQDLRTAQDFRDAIEKSALAKYIKGDPDKAIDSVWNARNPMAEADALMNGLPGIGGFKQDPMAMQGFQAGLIDRFTKAAQGDPARMIELMNTARGRLLKSVMGPSQFERLQRIIDRMTEVKAKLSEDEARKEKWTVVGQMVSLKLLHHAVEYVPFLGVGEGGSLKQASLVSGFAKDYISHWFAHDDMGQMLKKAVENPTYERGMFAKLPMEQDDMKQVPKMLRRMVGWERAVMQYYHSWTAYGKGPGITPDQEQTDEPFSWLTPSSANAMPMQHPDALPMATGPQAFQQGGIDRGMEKMPGVPGASGRQNKGTTNRDTDDMNILPPGTGSFKPGVGNAGDIVPGPTPNTIQGNLNATGPNAKGLDSMLRNGMQKPPLNVVPHPTLPGRIGLTKVSDKPGEQEPPIPPLDWDDTPYARYRGDKNVNEYPIQLGTIRNQTDELLRRLQKEKRQ